MVVEGGRRVCGVRRSKIFFLMGSDGMTGTLGHTSLNYVCMGLRSQDWHTAFDSDVRFLSIFDNVKSVYTS